MRKLTLNDGTEFDNSNCGLATGVLWCYLKDVTFHQALTAFDNPAKTSRIDFTYGEMVDSYEGYTQIIAVIQEAENQVNIALIRPASQGGFVDA